MNRYLPLTLILLAMFLANATAKGGVLETVRATLTHTIATQSIAR